MAEHNFGAAGPGETVVFGASRPGRRSSEPKNVSNADVEAWIQFMREAGIRRVVCLLAPAQLAYYSSVPGGLLNKYRSAFGQDNVLSASVTDYHLAEPSVLNEVIAFLSASKQNETPVVVHCSGGSGRTGHILAAWLARERGYDAGGALRVAHQTRNPYEAVQCGNATEAELIALVQGSEMRAA